MTAAATAPGDPSRRALRNAAVAAGALALLAFVPAMHGGFVYDDHRFVAENPHLREASVLWRAFSDPSCQTADGTHAGLWRPVRTLLFALEHAAFGGAPAGYHLVSAVLHAAGAALVALLLGAWRLPAAAAGAGAVLYALHPVQTETVAWIASQGDLIAAACVWAALLADLRGASHASLLLGAVALLAKGEQAVVWPALLVLSRLAAGRAFGESLRRAWIPAALAVVFVVVRGAVLDQPGQEGGLGHGPATPAVLGAILGHQAWLLPFPVGLTFDWQMPWVTSTPFAAGCVAIVVLAQFQPRGAALPAAWLLAAIAPTWIVQAVVPLNILVADRFLLFALPGFALAVGRAVASVRAPGPRRAALAAAGVVALCFGAITESAIPAWASDRALWTRTLERVPGHWRANAWLGIEALRDGRADEAESRLLEAHAASPSDAKTVFHLAQAQEVRGKLLRDDGRIAAALANYRTAVARMGDARAEGAAALLPAARWAEADLTLLSGDRDGARARFEDLLRDPPTAAEFAAVPAARVSQIVARVRAHLDGALADRIADRFRATETP